MSRRGGIPAVHGREEVKPPPPSRSYYYPPTVFGPLDRVDQLERDEATGKVRECGWCSTFTRGERHDCPNAPEGTQR